MYVGFTVNVTELLILPFLFFRSFLSRLIKAPHPIEWRCPVIGTHLPSPSLLPSSPPSPPSPPPQATQEGARRVWRREGDTWSWPPWPVITSNSAWNETAFVDLFFLTWLTPVMSSPPQMWVAWGRGLTCALLWALAGSLFPHRAPPLVFFPPSHGSS